MQNDVNKSIMSESQRSHTCLNKMGVEQFEEILKATPLLRENLCIYNQQSKSFEISEVTLVPNILIINDQYLVLSTCHVKKYKMTINGSEVEGIELDNYKGSIYMFFQQQQSRIQEWEKKLKTFCKLGHFVQKFRLLEQIDKEFFMAQKNSNKQIYTIQICPRNDLQRLESRYNEIQLLRTLKQEHLLDLKWVYEDQTYIYLLFEPFQGEKLDDLINLGMNFEESQLASLVLQIFNLLKFLNKHGAYHGNICAENIILNTSSQMFTLYLINLLNHTIQSETTRGNYLQIVNHNILSPEVAQKIEFPSIANDLYQVGLLLYQITFNQHNEQFKKEDNLISVAEQYLIGKQANPTLKSPFPHLYSVSQLDLVKRLLLPSRERIQIKDAIKHHWFINIRSKLRPKLDRKRKLPLPSIRTIIELCELSDMDMRSQLYCKGLSFEDEEVLDENLQIDDVMHQIAFDTLPPPSVVNRQFLKMKSKSMHPKLDKQPTIIQTKDLKNYKTIS